MRRIFGLVLMLSALLMLGVACMSYTYSDALKNIPAVPTFSTGTPISTHRQTPVSDQEVVAEAPLEEASLMGLTAENITFPYYHQVNENIVQLQGPVGTISALLAPLAEDGVADIALWPEASIIILTGNLQPMLAAIQELEMNTVLFAGGYAILTNLPIVTITAQSVIVEPISGKTLQVVAANLKDPSPLKSFQDTPDYLSGWQAAVQEAHVPRELAIQALLDRLEAIPTLFAASLFEPSDLDWTEFSQVPYRVPYDWPMSDFLAQQGYIDSYRASHFSEETDEGSTWSGSLQGMDLSERIDFLYAKDLIPVETKVVEYSAPGSSPTQSGVFGSFLIP